MRHAKRSTRLGRRTGHRLALLRNLATSLIKHRRVTTTHSRAKEVQRLAERLITWAKKGDLSAKRHVFRYVSDRAVARQLFDTIAPQYMEAKDKEERHGGFTRIVKVGPRKGDAAPMVFLELV
jgi:large subunit ribosomal protein L17